VPLMPSERQPTLPALDKLVPPELLNPAQQAAPPGTTPAERASANDPPAPSPSPPEPVTPTTPFGTTPATPPPTADRPPP